MRAWSNSVEPPDISYHIYLLSISNGTQANQLNHRGAIEKRGFEAYLYLPGYL